jgi:hypothetical protein
MKGKNKLPWNKISKYAAMFNYTDILNLASKELEPGLYYPMVARGASRGNNIPLLNQVLKLGYVPWNGIIRSLARAGNLKLIMYILSRSKLSQLDMEEIVDSAARGGHKVFIEKFIYHTRFRPVWSEVYIKAAKGGHLYIVRLAVNHNRIAWDDIGEMAATHGHLRVLEFIANYIIPSYWPLLSIYAAYRGELCIIKYVKTKTNQINWREIDWISTKLNDKATLQYARHELD